MVDTRQALAFSFVVVQPLGIYRQDTNPRSALVLQSRPTGPAVIIPAVVHIAKASRVSPLASLSFYLVSATVNALVRTRYGSYALFVPYLARFRFSSANIYTVKDESLTHSFCIPEPLLLSSPPAQNAPDTTHHLRPTHLAGLGHGKGGVADLRSPCPPAKDSRRGFESRCRRCFSSRYLRFPSFFFHLIYIRHGGMSIFVTLTTLGTYIRGPRQMGADA